VVAARRLVIDDAVVERAGESARPLGAHPPQPVERGIGRLENVIRDDRHEDRVGPAPDGLV
jgi:hypothetical protein